MVVWFGVRQTQIFGCVCLKRKCGIIEIQLTNLIILNLINLINTKLENPQTPPASIPDGKVWWNHHRVSSGWTLSQEWVIWTESPRSHELEFGQTFRMAGEGAPGKQKPKLFPRICYVRGQTLKPSASPSNEQRNPGSNQSLENGLV